MAHPQPLAPSSSTLSAARSSWPLRRCDTAAKVNVTRKPLITKVSVNLVYRCAGSILARGQLWDHQAPHRRHR